MSSISVLVLDPNFQTKTQIRSLPQGVSSKFKFILQDRVGLSNFYNNLQDSLEDAKKIVRENDVEIVLPISDVGALLKAALVQEFPHLRGPSVESVFLANNKYYTRCFLDPQPIPFASIDLTTTDLDKACEEALEKVGTPAFFKPVSCNGSKAISAIHNTQQLKRFALSYISSKFFTMECSNAKFMNPFYERNINKLRYPLAKKPAGIVEKFMKNAIINNSDSYILDGKIYHWSISDHLYSVDKPCYYLGGFLPTRLSASAQQKIWKVHDVVVRRMIEFGFNNDFVNVETFMLSSGEVKLVEVNPRRGGYLSVSGEAFKNGNVIEAELKLAQGEHPGTPIPTGRCALRGFIRTSGSGKAKDLYDFSYTDPRLVPDVLPEQVLDSCGESGSRLCQALVSGNSYEEVMEKYWSLCKKVLLKPELSVWK